MQIDTKLLPARGNDAVEILENDHDVIKGLLDKLTSANNSQRKTVLEKLVGVLTIHNATEENLVYPALNQLAGSKLESDHLYHETAAADNLVFELDGLLRNGDDAAFSAKAEKFADAVRAHIQEEENKALPRLRENIDPADAEQLAESVRMFRKSLHFETAA